MTDKEILEKLNWINNHIDMDELLGDIGDQLDKLINEFENRIRIQQKHDTLDHSNYNG